MTMKHTHKKKDMKLTLFFFLVTVLLLFHSGAFSNVYKAYDTKMDRMVAVKVVRKFELNAHQVRDKQFFVVVGVGVFVIRFLVDCSHVMCGYGYGCGLKT